jgi:hypothetical protein
MSMVNTMFPSTNNDPFSRSNTSLENSCNSFVATLK